MKIKQTLLTLAALTALLAAPALPAAVITSVGGGDWYSTSPNNPWPNGIVPQPTDDAIITPSVGIYSAPVTINNLTISGGGSFYNGEGLTVNANLSLSGTAAAQEGANVTVAGNMDIAAGSTYDPSCYNISVTGITTVEGKLEDLCNGAGLGDSFGGGITISGTWALSDVTKWSVGGSVTNLGTITGTSGSITCVGTGTLAGNPISIPNLTVSGTYEIATTVTVANNPTLDGTLIFDIGQLSELVTPGALTYGGALQVINSGAQPSSGASYQLFSASSYNGSFTSTSFPTLTSGSWINELTNGTIVVSGSAPPPPTSPTLTYSVSAGVLTLTWDTTDFPDFLLQSQTNSAGPVEGDWSDASSFGASPFTIAIDPTQPPVYFRLSNTP